MRRLLRRLVLFVGVPLLLLAMAAGVGGWLALRQFTPENVVRQLESVCNARVQLDGCSLSLFSSPARLELLGLQFHPRDAEADRATPPASRPPIKITNTYLRWRRGVVETDLVALLLRRELRVRSLLVEMGDVKADILPSGGNSLRALFQRPATVGGKPNPAMVALVASAAVVAQAAEIAAPAPTAVDRPPDPADEGDAETEESADARLPVFHASELPGAISINRISFADGRLRLRNRKTRAVTELNQLNLEITGLEVNPANLAEHNRAALTFRSRLWVDGGRKNPGRLAEMQAGFEGTLVPFDATTGLLQPDFQFTTRIDQGATLRSLPALEKIEKNLARARRAGLQISPLSKDVVLARDTALRFRLRNHTLALVEPGILEFADYSLALAAGSSLDIGTETHDLSASWIASQAVSDKALSGAQEFLGKAGEDVARELRGVLIDPLVKDGRLHMDFTSTGEMAKPNVRIGHPLQDAADQLKDAGRGLLERIKNN
jgi:hypothetical protein